MEILILNLLNEEVFVDKDKVETMYEAVENMKNAMNRVGIAVSEATNEFSIFSDILKSIKDRYNPVVYWMYEVGILKD